MTLETFCKRTHWPLEELLDTPYLEFNEVLQMMGLRLAFVANRKQALQIVKQP